jgi:nitroreductase
MELNTAIETRTTVRKFSSETVPVSDLKEMVKAAGLAPSVNNSQPWKFIAITNLSKIKQMAQIVHQKIDVLYSDIEKSDENAKATVDYFSTIFENAPSMIAVAITSYHAVSDKINNAPLSHEKMNEYRNYPDIQSVGAAVQNVLLKAVDLGYGSCWLSGLMVAKEELEAELGIEGLWQLATVVAIGKPAGETKRREKKSPDDIFIYLD